MTDVLYITLCFLSELGEPDLFISADECSPPIRLLPPSSFKKRIFLWVPQTCLNSRVITAQAQPHSGLLSLGFCGFICLYVCYGSLCVICVAEIAKSLLPSLLPHDIPSSVTLIKESVSRGLLLCYLSSLPQLPDALLLLPIFVLDYFLSLNISKIFGTLPWSVVY